MPFKKGKSGNPGGRPKVADELRKRALKAVDEHVVQAWIDEVRGDEQVLMDKTGMPVLDKKGNIILKHERGENWVKCSELLAAYGLGKPVQPIAGVGDDGGIEGPVSLTVKYVKADGK